MKRTQPNGRKNPTGARVVRRKTLNPSQRWGWIACDGGRKLFGSTEGYTSEAYARAQMVTALSGGYSYLLDGGK